MAYKIFDNTNFALNDERENGFIVYFKEKNDFHNYQFGNLDGVSIVEALWSPSGYVNESAFFLSKVWFAAERVRSFNDLHIVKRDPAYPEKFIEKTVMELKESVFQALLSGSLEGVLDGELQYISKLGGYGSTFVDDLHRAIRDLEVFSRSWHKDGSIFPAHDQKVIVMVNGERKRVDPKILLDSRDYLLSQLEAELFRREPQNEAYQKFLEELAETFAKSFNGM